VFRFAERKLGILIRQSDRLGCVPGLDPHDRLGICLSAEGAAFMAAWGSAQEVVRAKALALKARFHHSAAPRRKRSKSSTAWCEKLPMFVIKSAPKSAKVI